MPQSQLSEWDLENIATARLGALMLRALRVRDDDGDAPSPVEGYEILDRLGEGASGTVWRGVQRATGRQVALKLLHAAACGSYRARQRFEREVELTARLSHPHIARLYDSGAHRGVWFYAMELIDGLPLDRYAAEHGLDARQLLRLMGEICRAVQHAHQVGVIHRDLKPSNILVTEDGQPHVLDFGLGRAMEEGRDGLTLSLAGEVAGTPAFMSPEQASGNIGAVDTRSDVYSLGAILYLLLTGRPPHDLSGSSLDVLRRIARGEIARPRWTLWHIRPRLCSAEGRRLADNPSDLDGTQPRAAVPQGRKQPGAAVPHEDTVGGGVALWKNTTEGGCAPWENTAGGGCATAIDGELETILLKALSHEPERRYASAGALADDIENYLKGDPLTARPPTLAYWVGRRARKHRLPLGIAAMVCGALIAMAVYSYFRIAGERNVALTAGARAEHSLRLAEQSRQLAERRLCDSLLAQADDLSGVQQFNDARSLYEEARQKLIEQHRSELPAEMGLLDTYRFAPPPLIRFIGHRGPVHDAAFSPDGRRVASAGADGTVRIWDVLTGRTLRTFAASGGEVLRVTFCPDGKSVISATKNGTIQQWDLSRGRQTTLVEHAGHRAARWEGDAEWEGDVLDLACSPDQRLLAWTAFGCPAKVWTFATKSVQVVHYKLGGYWDPAFIAFGPDSRTCWGANTDRFGSFDALSGQPVFDKQITNLPNMPGTQRPVVSSDGRQCLTGLFGDTRSDNLRLWSIPDRSLIRTFAGHMGGVSAPAFCPGGAQVVSAGKTDHAVRFWDIATGRLLRTIWGDNVGFCLAAFSSDARTALSWGDDGVLRLWDLDDSDSSMEQDAPLHRRDGALAISPDGQLLAFGGSDQLTLCAATDWKVLSRRHGKWGDLNELAFSPDDKWIAAGSGNGKLWLFRAGDGQFVRQLGSHDMDVRSIMFTPDGRLTISNNGNTLRAWRVPSGEMAWTSGGDATLAHGLGLSPDGRTVFAQTTHGHLFAFDINSGAPRPRWVQLEAPDHLEYQFAYVHGATGLVGCVGTELMLWDVSSGKLKRRFTGRPGMAVTLAISPDERWVASGAMDGTVTIWDLATCREVHTFDGHVGPARRLVFAPSGERLYSAGEAGQVRCWDFTRPEAYREFATKVADATRLLQQSPDDPRGLTVLADWYAFRHRDDWAAEIRARIPAENR